MLKQKNQVRGLYKKYYSDKSVLYELVKLMKGRESSVLGVGFPPVRCMKIHSINFLESNFKAFNFWSRVYNIYTSIAKLEDMPTFSYAPPIRKKQQIMFNREFDNYVVGYDAPFDFDCDKDKIGTDDFDDMATMWDMKEVMAILDEYQVPYYVKCSGRGFHLEIPSEVMKLYCKDINQIPQTVGFMAKTLKGLLDLKTLDDSIYDSRRIWKTPYSLDVKSGNVALPLNKTQIDNFSWDMVKVDTVLRDGVRGRGLILFNDGTTEEMKKSITSFMNEIIYGKQE